MSEARDYGLKRSAMAFAVWVIVAGATLAAILPRACALERARYEQDIRGGTR